MNDARRAGPLWRRLARPLTAGRTMQGEVEAFLESAMADGSQARRIDTHAAMVFLRGDRALKIKRAIKLPFLDFSTLARRKQACEAELAANRPFAPDIYRAVVPVTRERDGSLAIGGKGEPVEWALDMVRFDENATLDKLALRHEITPRLALAVADAIASAHARAAIIRTSGWTESIDAIIRQNADSFGANDSFAVTERDELETLSRQLAARLQPQIRQRNDDGFVRHCHGDLHLANLVVIAGKPVLFDAIEFDERLAITDVMHDLAFTLMDLIHFGAEEAATILLNRYLSLTPPDNLAAIGMLALSISMRAAVRANVLMCRTALIKPADGLAEAAAAYFSLARAALKPPPPCLIAIGGLSGSGKSATARALAPPIGAFPGAVVLRSDVIRKRLLGLSELERLPPAAYAPESSAAVYTELARQAAIVLQHGHSVIVDAVFAREAERSRIEAVAAEVAVPFVGIFLAADRETRLQRIRKRSNDASDATADVAELQEQYDIGHLTWTTIHAGGSRRATLDLCKARLPKACLRRKGDA